MEPTITFKVSKFKSIKGFTSFHGIIFETGSFDATFAAYKPNEVYIFKVEHYIRIYVTPGVAKDNIIGGSVVQIVDYWKGIGRILPLKYQSIMSFMAMIIKLR